jgi:hypothetical protein
VLAVPGLWRVSIEASPGLAEALALNRTGRTPNTQWASAIAPVKAGLHQWGQLRICFELSSEMSRSPLGFTRYLAQQIAGLLDRAALRYQRDNLRLQVSALARRLQTRKAVGRAIGLIARRDHVSPEAALARVAAVARRHRRSLLLTAQSVIFLEGEGGTLQSPAFRRLLPTETTGTRSFNGRYPTLSTRSLRATLAQTTAVLQD